MIRGAIFKHRAGAAVAGFHLVCGDIGSGDWRNDGYAREKRTGADVAL
jgi:hypothetical protein